MKLIKSLSALVAVASIAVSAQAAVAGFNDLVIGFQTTGVANDVLIDLGSYTQYTAPGVYTIGNYNSALTSAFGDWKNDANIQWGAVATNSTVDKFLATTPWADATAGVAALGTAGQTSGVGIYGQSALGGPSTSIQAVYTAINTATSSNYTQGVALTASNSAALSWTKKAPFQLTKADLLNPNISNGDAFTASDLYLIQPSVQGSLVGTFAVASTGDITFTVIPEPSTYAIILGALTIGFVALRRRFSKAV